MGAKVYRSQLCVQDLKREVRDIKGAAPVRATLIFYIFGDLPEKTY